MRIEEFSKTKCKVFFEDYSTIILYKNDLRRYSITEGAQLTERQLNVLLEELLPYRAKARCMKLLQSKDYTETEIRKKLQKDGYPESVIEVAISYLYSYKYLDDEKYVTLYYQSKCLKKSRKQIILDLQQKGIDKNTVITVMDKLAYDNDEKDELQCIRKLLFKRKYNDAVADITDREKVKAYLFRKGFEICDINVCMQNFNWENM